MISLGSVNPTTALSQELIGTSVSLVGKSAITVGVVTSGLADGSSAKVYFQGAIGNVWFDIACLAFTTGSVTKDETIVAGAVSAAITRGSGALTDNTAVQGCVPDMVRAIVTTTGTYTAGSVAAYYTAY